MRKQFIHRVQDLGKKAAEIKQAIQSAPAKAAELREAVTMTAGELHQLRTDVQSSLNGLRANTEERLLQAMREINDNTYTFEEAGYELTGMDLDLGLNQRLAVHLQKFEEVSHTTLRGLLSKETCETVKSILSGILKAEETAANIELSHLKHDGVIVHVGAIPLIRTCWRSDTLIDQLQTTAAAPAPQSATPPSSTSPAFGSFFEQRTIPSSTATPQMPVPPPTSALPVDSAATTASTSPSPASEKATVTKGSPWSSEALARFKKMPDLSRHSR